jgi:hypothetical protein
MLLARIDELGKRLVRFTEQIPLVYEHITVLVTVLGFTREQITLALAGIVVILILTLNISAYEFTLFEFECV